MHLNLGTDEAAVIRRRLARRRWQVVVYKTSTFAAATHDFAYQ